MIWQILKCLIDHFVAIVNEGGQVMVVRKLASSLVAVFRHTSSSWKRALLQVAASLANGGYVSEQEALTVDFLNGVLPHLDTQKAAALTFFSVALAEDALRLETEPQELVGSVIQRVVDNIKDAFLLVQCILQRIPYLDAGDDGTSLESILGNEAMHSWRVSRYCPRKLIFLKNAILTLLFFLYVAWCIRKPPPLLRQAHPESPCVMWSGHFGDLTNTQL